MTPFKFWIRKDAGTYYYVDPDITSGSFGTVQTDGSASAQAELKHIMPDWGQLGFVYDRHPAYFGIFSKFTPDKVRFVGDAAVILKYIKNTYDIDGDAELEVWQLNNDDGTYALLDVYKIDLTKHESYPLYFDAPLIAGGIAAIVDQFAETEYEIELNDPGGDAGVEWAYLDGVIMLGKYNYQMLPYAQAFGLATIGAIANITTVPLIYTNREGDYEVGTATPAVIADVDLLAAYPDSMFFKLVLENTQTSIRVESFTILFDFGQTGAMTFTHLLVLKVKFFDSTGADMGLDEILWQSNAGVNLPDGYYGPVNVPAANVSVPGGVVAGCSYALFWEYSIDTALGGSDTTFCHLQTYLIPGVPVIAFGLGFQYLQPPTFCRTMRAQELFSRLVGKLGGSTYSGYGVMTSNRLTATPTLAASDEWVDLIPNDMKYTCGDAIRELYTDGLGNPTPPKIVISLRKFAEDVFTCLCAGIGIEDDSGTKKLVCEHITHFYDTGSSPYDFGSRVKNLIMTPYNEHRHGKLMFGYEDVQLDSVNGRYDAWSDQRYRSSLRADFAEGNYQSPFSASPYEIEITRANLANKQTTDSQQDNKVFKVVTKSSTDVIDGVTCYQLAREWSSLTGVPSEVTPLLAGSLFNVELSPARNLVRMFPFLMSNYTGNLAVQLLEPQTATKNRNMTATIAWGLIGEFAQWDLLGSGVSSPVWQPWLLTFEAEMPSDLISIMAATPYGQFKVTVGDVAVNGFVNKIGVVPGRNSAYTVQLILAPGGTLPTVI